MFKEIVKYPRFSEIKFIRLYCAMNFKYKCSPIIKHHELEKRLYEFYYLPEFRDLFEDICPKKDYINPQNSYLDLGIALQTARLLGLLTPIQGVGEVRSVVSCGKNIAQEIISNADIEMVDKMANLFNKMFNLDNSLIEKESTKTSNSELVMNNFMGKFDSSDSTCDKEPIGAELVSDEDFICNQVSYSELLKSPIIQGVHGQKLVKRRK